MTTPDSQKKQESVQEIENALQLVRSGLAIHKGGVELVDIDMENGIVSVRLIGACVGCAFADVTLKDLIEETVMDSVPWVREVIAVPSSHEHAST